MTPNVNEIRSDIDSGIYDNWPKVKSRLLNICEKLKKSEYVVNYQWFGQKKDIKYLKDYGY